MTRAGLALVALLAAACAPVGYESPPPAGVDPAVITDVHARLDEARWTGSALKKSSGTLHAPRRTGRTAEASTNPPIRLRFRSAARTPGHAHRTRSTSSIRCERLLVFSAPDGHADLARMRERVAADPAGLADRDLTVAWLAGPDGTFGDTPLAPTAVATLRAATDLSPDAFGGVLIGKDGGIKNRYAAPIELAEAFALIDTMPMRRREMREDG